MISRFTKEVLVLQVMIYDTHGGDSFVFGILRNNDEMDPLQVFQVQNVPDEAFKFIELDILSNHGNLNYTCLYRFRVHGTPS